MAGQIRLVAFDLDGTLTRGETVIQVIACAMGHLDRVLTLEAQGDVLRDRQSVRLLREEVARYYSPISREDLIRHLAGLTLAPGVREAFRDLHASRIETAIVTFTLGLRCRVARMRAGRGPLARLAPPSRRDDRARLY